MNDPESPKNKDALAHTDGGGNGSQEIAQVVVIVLAVLLFIAARLAARQLPADGFLRQRAGPALALLLIAAGTVTITVPAWRVWRGTTTNPYPRAILTHRLRERLGAALPAVAIACWGGLIGTFVAVVFPAKSGGIAVTVTGFLALGIVITFGFFAYAAARWHWPRFVLPAEMRKVDRDSTR